MAYRPPAIPVPPQGMTLADVTLVSPGLERETGQTVVVEGNRIVHISSEQPARTGQREATLYAGAFVVPGLMDSHVHIPPLARELASILFLAHGVTTVRETGDADGSTWEARRRIRLGQVPGPRIFASGPVLDGDPPFLFTSWALRNAVQAREAVMALAAQGADFIKVHHKLSLEVLAAIRETAAVKGLRIVGHIPTAVPFEQAGIWDVQHLDGLVPYPQPPETSLDYQKKWRDLDPARLEAYIQTSVQQGLVHTPTLVTWNSLIRLADPHRPDDQAIQWLPRYYRDGAWNRENNPLFSRFSDETLRFVEQARTQAMQVVRRLHQAGVRIHLGTDTAAMPFVIPGASLHEELKLMVEAGLSLEAAWIAGTRAGGKSSGKPLLGTLQPGAPADLLLFEKDPTHSLSALSTLKAVMADGRLYSKELLDGALVQHRERFRQPLYSKLTTALIRLGLKLMTSSN